MNIIDLDNKHLYQELDPAGMGDHIANLPRQCQQAWQMASDFKLPSDFARAEKVVVLGMGGSAIGGDLARGLVMAEAKVPILVHRDYHLPAFVDNRTLVIASSYSGETEETLSAFTEALSRKSRVMVITAGGKLKKIAGEKKLPVFTFDFKAAPRAALGFSLLPILCFLQQLGIVMDKSKDVADMVRTLEDLSGKLNPTVPAATNPAKQLAHRLYGRLPVIYGADIAADVARRWKTQFNENSKAFAFYEILPELDHNAVVGYEFPKEIAAIAHVVMLRTPSLEPRLQQRYRVTGEILDRAGVGHEFVDGAGGSPLSQVMSLVLTGDFASYYLAMLYRTDPSPVKVIDYLKAQLAGK